MTVSYTHLEVFDPDENKLFADKSLLDEFGKSTILSTWLVRDGYGLTVEPAELDLSGYKGYFIDKHLYLIDTEIPNEAIEAVSYTHLDVYKRQL